MSLRDGIRIEPLATFERCIPEVARWFYEEWRELYSADETPETISERIVTWTKAEDIPYALVAVRGAAVLGIVALKWREPAERNYGPWLAGLYVLPAERGRGLGRSLVFAAETAAQERGIETLYLATPASRTFYESLGWSSFETIFERGVEVTLMRKNLSR